MIDFACLTGGIWYSSTYGY